MTPDLQFKEEYDPHLKNFLRALGLNNELQSHIERRCYFLKYGETE